MPYTKETLRNDLRTLHASAWQWAGNAPKPTIDKTTGKAPEPPKRDASEEITNYCWIAYEKAFTTSGDQAIGRVNHLSAAGLYEKVAEIVGDETMRADAARGNLLKMDKWATVLNDGWLLGGVHRQAKFRLVSPRVMENLWNFQGGFPVVTARELLGLLHFGYQVQQVGPWQILSLADPGRAAKATLVEYDRLMKDQGTIRNVLALLDRSRLKFT